MRNDKELRLCCDSIHERKSCLGGRTDSIMTWVVRSVGRHSDTQSQAVRRADGNATNQDKEKCSGKQWASRKHGESGLGYASTGFEGRSHRAH